MVRKQFIKLELKGLTKSTPPHLAFSLKANLQTKSQAEVLNVCCRQLALSKYRLPSAQRAKFSQSSFSGHPPWNHQSGQPLGNLLQACGLELDPLQPHQSMQRLICVKQEIKQSCTVQNGGQKVDLEVHSQSLFGGPLRLAGRWGRLRRK